MDCDRVCVMDAGLVAEYDSPANLLRKEGGIFRGMVVAANDPSLFDMVPGCSELKVLLEEKKMEVSAPVVKDDEVDESSPDNNGVRS